LTCRLQDQYDQSADFTGASAVAQIVSRLLARAAVHFRPGIYRGFSIERQRWSRMDFLDPR
jgi:hypothetical protein